MYYVVETEEEFILCEGDDILLRTLKHQALPILEYVAGKTLLDTIRGMLFSVSDEVSRCWDEARKRFYDHHKKIVPFHITPSPETPYLYFYQAISDPERIAGIRKDRMVRHIGEHINNNFASFKRTWVEFIETQGLRKFLASPLIYWHPKELEESELEQFGTLLKTGKAARMMCGRDDVEVFAGYLQDTLYKTNPENMEVWTDDKPSTIYMMEHHEDITSCMIPADDNQVTEEYFQIYDRIEDCSIAVISEEDQYGNTVVLARALLWNNVYVNHFAEPIKIMDRIYYASNRHLMAMQRWARKEGYYHKAKQALGETNFVAPNGSTEQLPYMKIKTSFSMEVGKFRFVPYMDTFQYVQKNMCLMYSTPSSGPSIARLCDTEGDGDWLTYGTHETCQTCGEELDKRHFEYDGYHYCNNCRDEQFTKCEVCKDYHPDNSVSEHEVNGNDIYICEDCLRGYEYCSYTDSYWDRDEFVEVEFPDGTMKWVSRGGADANFYCCNDCDKWFHKDCGDWIGEDWYCNDCIDDMQECPCCHQHFSEKEVYNHSLHIWVCPKCYHESKIQEKVQEPCGELDKKFQIHILDYM